jgi:hypothetical protein
MSPCCFNQHLSSYATILIERDLLSFFVGIVGLKCAYHGFATAHRHKGYSTKRTDRVNEFPQIKFGRLAGVVKCIRKLLSVKKRMFLRLARLTTVVGVKGDGRLTPRSLQLQRKSCTRSCVFSLSWHWQ